MSALRFFCSAFLCLVLLQAKSSVIDLTDPYMHNFLGNHLEILVDSTNSMVADDVIKNPNFRSSFAQVPNLGITNYTYWIRIRVNNFSSSNNLAIEVKQPGLDFITFFSIKNGILESLELSDQTMLSERPIPNQNYCFPLNLNKNEFGVYLLKVNTADHLMLPVIIDDITDMKSAHSREDVIFGIFSGILLALILYSLIVFLGLRDRSYILYVVYVLVMYLNHGNLLGYSSRCFWPNSLWLERLGVYFLIPFSGILGILFILNFLELNKEKANYRLPLYVSIGVYTLIMILGVLDMQNLAYKLIEVNGSLIAIYIFVICLVLWRKGNKAAGSMFMAWSVFLFGLTIFIFKDLSLLPYNDFTVHTMTIGTAAQGILLSFGLANRINQLKREKEAAQVREIEAMKYNEHIIRNQNVLLENKVHERTMELEATNHDLQTSYNDLRMTQKQLLESEKLASLGQMTAGIAHELNNPINFVSSNVGPLRRDVEDIVNLLLEYHGLGTQATPEQLEGLKSKYNQMGIDFAREEIGQLLQGIEEGSKRTSDIVKGLRIFARADKDTIVNANINDCLNSTLVVMKSAYKGEVNLSREVDMQMPAVDCYPGKLNQVLVNLINNAVHATNLPGRSPKDRIVIVKSYFDEKNIYISVKDNGCGIPPEVKTHIFEPFYTTKGVGEGTGLGLAIVLGIVEEHDGKIEVFTEKDKGTEFIIHLPRHRNQRTLTAA
jgi:two-component system, NtrC family, sensor kinase